MNNDKIFLELTGNADDLLMVSDANMMKCTRLIKLPDSMDINEEVIDVCITSTNPGKGEFPVFDKLLGRKIKITVEFED